MHRKLLVFSILLAACTSISAASSATLQKDLGRQVHQKYIIAAVPDDATLSSIANGHAYQKHVIDKKEYPNITSKAQFLSLIKSIVTTPTASKSLVRGRTAYWSATHSTIVIVDPSTPDKGTAFVTTKAYYDSQPAAPTADSIDDVTN
jgi:hypothetical protein